MMLPENIVKKRLKEGEVVLGTMMSVVRNPAVSGLIAQAGFDFLIFNMEHADYSIQTVSDLLLGARATGIPALVRVPDTLYHLMARTLDCGASGLIIPRTETKEQVETIIRSTKYAPLGARGASTRAAHSDFSTVGAAEFVKKANEETLIVLQVETKKGIDNLEEMLSVAGPDVAFIGPLDLSQTLGVTGQITHPEELKCFQRVIDVAEKHAVAPGIHLNDMEMTKEWIGRGMRFIVFRSDISMLADAAKPWTKELKDYAQSIRKG